MSSTLRGRRPGGYTSVFYVLFFLVAFVRPVWLQSTPQDPDYTCSADKPCAVGCCDKFGICGMGPDFCSPENCVNSCDAKSECDPANWGPQYALSEGCPLNVCCSKFGFCGTTEEFCGDEVVANPSCSGNSAEKRTIGYYESWAATRSCDAVTPEQLPWESYTHINFAFATIDPHSFVVVPSSPDDLDLYRRLTNLKTVAPGLQVWISIGGWSMNDPDQPTATTFSDLAASPLAQENFANSLIQLMSTYGFDGVDIDWEYPVAPERSGRPEDYANYPTWLSNLRGAFSAAGHNWGLSITLPSSFWYLRNFDIVKLEGVVDWFNMMEYDLHGTWDSTDVWIGAFVNAHTNLTEIDESLKLLWRNNIDPSKVVLGLGFYGRSFTLEDPSCIKPGCPFTGGAPAGPCTGEVGTLSFSEIESIIAGGGATVTLDIAAAVQIVTWDGNWASYDDASTLQTKLKYANNNCLGGTMVWATSLDDSSGTASNALRGSGSGPKSGQVLISQSPLSSCGWSDCIQPGGSPCPAGQSSAFSTTDGCGVTNDQMAQAGTDSIFPHRYYCCPSNQMPSCTLQTLDPSTHYCGSTACPADTVNIYTGRNPFGTNSIDCPNSPNNVCCKAPNVITARSLECFFTACGANSCPSGTSPLVSTTYSVNGEPSCLDGTKQTLCCPAPLAIDTTSCMWRQNRALRGICTAGCPAGKIEVARDINQGSCLFGFSSYCCDPPANTDAAVTEGLNEFKAIVQSFLSGGTCTFSSSTLSSKRDGSPGVVTTLEMAEILANVINGYNDNGTDKPYFVAALNFWNEQVAVFNSNAPNSAALIDSVIHATTDIVTTLTEDLCPELATSTFDPIVCSIDTCGAGASGAGACPLTKRARARTPADIFNIDTTLVTASRDYTSPTDVNIGLIPWWTRAKNLDWWQGSNHGVETGTGRMIGSSFYQPFDQQMDVNVFTGAGPVWGCTIVAVVSDAGAWTAHFWQPFFNKENDLQFQTEVLNFLQNGNAAENYPGLAQLFGPGRPFDKARNQFIYVVIMSPRRYTQQNNPNPAVRPLIIQDPNDGPLYPDRLAAIQNQIRAIFQAPGLGIYTYLYNTDQSIWNWVEQEKTDPNTGVKSIHWTWKLDRSVRLDNAPWTGMMTIQRRATSSIDLDPSVRLLCENNLIFTREFNA